MERLMWHLNSSLPPWECALNFVGLSMFNSLSMSSWSSKPISRSWSTILKRGVRNEFLEREWIRSKTVFSRKNLYKEIFVRHSYRVSWMRRALLYSIIIQQEHPWLKLPVTLLCQFNTCATLWFPWEQTEENSAKVGAWNLRENSILIRVTQGKSTFDFNYHATYCTDSTVSVLRSQSTRGYPCNDLSSGKYTASVDRESAERIMHGASSVWHLQLMNP